MFIKINLYVTHFTNLDVEVSFISTPSIRGERVPRIG